MNTSETPSQEGSSPSNTMVLRLPKPNAQVVVLGLVAIITLFQTVQLSAISGKAGSVQVKSVSTTTSGDSGSSPASNADVPQSMVGGC